MFGVTTFQRSCSSISLAPSPADTAPMHKEPAQFFSFWGKGKFSDLTNGRLYSSHKHARSPLRKMGKKKRQNKDNEMRTEKQANVKGNKANNYAALTD